MSTYNRERMMMEAVGSVLAQRQVDLELFVVDNGSGPATEAALGQVKDPRLRVLRNETSLGGTGGRNTGLRAATGQCVAFCDDDDLWAPTKLRAQLDEQRRTGRRWSYTGCVYLDARGRILGGVPAPSPDQVAANLPVQYRVPGGISSMVWERDALDGELDERLSLSTDWDLALRLLDAVGPPAGVIEPLTGYRQHGRNLSTRAAERFWEFDVIEEKFDHMLDGRQLDRAAAYRFFGSEAARVGLREEALRSYLAAFKLGDMQVVPRALGAMLPRAIHPWLRRHWLSDRQWMAKASAWLGPPASEPGHPSAVRPNAPRVRSR